ncbi:hypothetical protein A2V71_04635 [Candidatus Berkelbacteria bacterium RBG_13_40_8]|uniref:Lipoyl-binding domain-containing protein n=1 Tax=Candidatus Berkelbacteria bacterium RBG_13_40_8 TaxID=1797467 RepID=A0A1F5DMK7_9BACT|nr:MAG: hypothetical protein A2V71_04635 [Candidatus Berkelbacteria bacterium RBG_13_40_8]
MDAILVKAAKGDFQLLHAALLFESINHKVARKLLDFHGVRITFDRWDIMDVLTRFPGHQKGKYKVPDAQILSCPYTPPYVKRGELVTFSKKVIQTVRKLEGHNRPFWTISEKHRFHLVTAVTTIRLFRRKHRFKKTTLMVREPDAGTIEAPLKGMFYRREHESEPPLVEVGDIVEKGQKFFVIEVQKNYLLIYAENRMEILEIVAQDATVVEEGDTLFRVKILPDNEEEC